MTTALIPARDIVAGVRSAFRGAGACHCHTVVKLGEDEVLDSLVYQGVVTLGDIHGIAAITIEMLNREMYRGSFGKLARNAIWALEKRVKYLVDLQEFTFANLLTLPGMGRTSARSVERMMAEFGLLLKDGDPAFLEAVREEKQAEGRLPAPPSDQSPEDIRMSTARALIEIGEAMMRDGASLTKTAAKIGFGDTMVATTLSRYVTEHKQNGHDEVARITAPFLALCAADKERGHPRLNRPAKAEELVPQIETESAVVRVAFGPGG